MSTQQQIPPAAQMAQMITGYWTSCCIYTAAKLNIAELVAVKPQTAEQLAEKIHADAPSLYRLLRALASVGIFSENEKGEFSQTPLSETLQADVPGSTKAFAIMLLGDHFPAWGNLTYSVKTGHVAFEKVEDMNLWQYYENHPEEGLNFMKAMTGMTAGAIAQVIPGYDFSQFKTIVDVGGGNGAFLMAALDTNKNATGIVFDQEYVITETENNVKAKDYADRCSAVSGDFFESVPAGADCYIVKHILHDWDDEKSAVILNNISKAMNSGSKLLIIEPVIATGNTPHPGKYMDINMMVITGGKERTEKEFATLVEKAGLKISQVVTTASPMLSIVEVVKK